MSVWNSEGMSMTTKRSRVLRAAIIQAIRPWLPSVVAASAAVLPLEFSIAADECGGYAPGAELICDATGNPYPSGIIYPSVTDDITVRITTGTTIAPTAGSLNHGLDIYGPGYDFSVFAEEGVTINVVDSGRLGIKLVGSAAQSVVTSADITATYMAVGAEIDDAASSSAVSITQLANGIARVTEADGAGLYGQNNGTGDATVTSAGRIEANVGGTYGLFAGASNIDGGSATTYLAETGSIELSGVWNTGLYSLGKGKGLIRAAVAGDIEITGDDAVGAIAYAEVGATGDVLAELSDTGSIRVDGDTSYGLWALQSGSGNVQAQSSGAITVQGTDSYGILVTIGDATTASASASLNGGSITTRGTGAHSLVLDVESTGASTIQLLSDVKLVAEGVGANGVDATAAGALSLTQSQASSIAANGANSIGVRLIGSQDVAAQLGGTVSARGEYGVGIVTSGIAGTAQLTIDSTAEVMGGWQADIAGTGAAGLPTAGVAMRSDTAAHLINRGAIGANSDRAILAEGTGAATVDNFSVLTGFVELTGSGANVFNNAALFELRHYADTDGDGARDTKRVAISDFGSTTSTFNNASGATVRLAAVASAATTDATSYYVPTTGVDQRALGGGVYDLNRAGIVQGQLVNLGTFNHSGVIDLRGSQTGNTLVITGASSANGAPGNGVFVSNGGTLLLNVALNEGISPGGQSGSIADVLIVDGTQMGTGATAITLDRKEGSGALTPGNGILLVEVRDKARSAADVFTLNGDYTHNGLSSVVVGAYAYSLFHNGTDSDAADGNWYLRSSMLDLEPSDPNDPNDPIDPTDPNDPNNPGDPVTAPDPGAPPAPRFQPGVPLYESYSMNLQALNMLPTLQQRVGNRVWSSTADQESTGAWGRTYGGSSRSRAGMSPSGAEHSVDAWKMQLGLDHLAVTSDAGNRLVASLAIDYGQADSSIRSIFGNGKLETESYGLGTMWTWYRHTGLYVDVQAQVNRFRSDLYSNLLGQLVRDNDGRGEAFGVELGKVVPLGDEWSVTPQAQLSVSNVRFDRFVDPMDAVVSTHDADSRVSRAGIAVNRDYEVHERRNHWYGIANLSYEWGNGLHANVSGVQLRRMDRRAWGEIGVGGSINWSNGVRLYGEVSGKSPLRDIGDSYVVHGNIGLAVQF